MENKFQRKYKKIREILPDIAACAGEKLVLIGGTALSLFYLNHRASIDLDFVPVTGDDAKVKQEFKGAVSKMGYRTLRTAFSNQFAISFEDATIKVEIFTPDDMKLDTPDTRDVGREKILIASLKDLLLMKTITYARRKYARDLFDIFCFPENKGQSLVVELVKKHGKPTELEELADMVFDISMYEKFLEVVKNVT